MEPAPPIAERTLSGRRQLTLGDVFQARCLCPENGLCTITSLCFFFCHRSSEVEFGSGGRGCVLRIRGCPCGSRQTPWTRHPLVQTHEGAFPPRLLTRPPRNAGCQPWRQFSDVWHWIGYAAHCCERKVVGSCLSSSDTVRRYGYAWRVWSCRSVVAKHGELLASQGGLLQVQERRSERVMKNGTDGR